MKIAKVEIYNYKSIGQKCLIDFDGKSTILVGKSNVGKTNILEAIYFAFDDEPLKKEYICSWNNNEPLSVKVFLKVEETDIPQIEKIDASFSKLKFIIVSKYVDGKVEYNAEPDIPVKKVYEPSDEVKESLSNFRARIRRILRASSKITNQLASNDPLKMSFSSLDTFVNADKKLNPMQSHDEQKASLDELLLLLKSIRKELNRQPYRNLDIRGIKMRLAYVISDITDFLPNIKYNERVYGPLTQENLYDLLPEVYYLSSDAELEINEEIFVDDIRKADSNNFMKGLIDLSEIDVSILERGDGREIADPLKEANDNIAKRLSRYWNQEKLRIVLRAELDPENSKRKIELDFIGGEERRSSIFDQSPGTQWFMAFSIEYLANKSDESDSILLLDEPGIMLHAGAQKDLLERFEGTDPNVQIIYTTHSPYMINKNFPLRIRCVEKGDGTDGTIRGTYVNQKPYDSPKSRAWEPIRSSIGLSLGDSLFVGGVNLIVEGISDQIILSSIIQTINNLENKTKFDLNKVSITFAGNYANLIALAMFCHQETENAKVLLDGDTGARNRDKLTNANFPKSRIFIINEILDKSQIDIESLFEPNFYHDCVLEAYRELEPLDIHSKLPKNWPEIEKEPSKHGIPKTEKWGHSKYYAEYFHHREDEIGRFDKVLVSKKLAYKIMSLSKDEQRTLIKPFDKLITKIWQQEPSWF